MPLTGITALRVFCQAKFRVAALSLAVLTSTGCSLSVERYEAIIRNCNDYSVDCRLESIRARVLESFPSTDVREVLVCATEPTMFCASTQSITTPAS
jgi:hypothetical protein